MLTGIIFDDSNKPSRFSLGLLKDNNKDPNLLDISSSTPTPTFANIFNAE